MLSYEGWQVQIPGNAEPGQEQVEDAHKTHRVWRLGAGWGRSRAQLYLAACGELPGNATPPGHLHKARVWQGKG